MSDLQNVHVDWNKIKEILNDVINILQPVVDILPPGLPKVILSGILSALHILINSLPNG